MATMKINVEAELSLPVSEGTIGGLLSSETLCISKFDVVVKTTTQVWIEWDILALNYTIMKTSGNSIAVDGELLTEYTTYRLTLDGYKTPKSANDYYSDATFRIRDVQGGTILDSKVFTRIHSELNC
tara:strand:- start:7591 stop:7971 length:381 start_codon:yes stop_codon:yes gene_type:complete